MPKFDASQVDPNDPLLDPALLAAATSMKRAVEHWHAGQQESAIEETRPAADQGDPLACLMMAWFLSQRPNPDWVSVLHYAELAVAGGYPHAASYGVTVTQRAPILRARAIALVRSVQPLGVQALDPVGALLQYVSDDDDDAIAALMRPVTVPGPGGGAREWAETASTARQHLESIAASRRAAELQAAEAQTDTRRITEQNAALAALIAQATSAEATSAFEGEAKQSKVQADSTWRAGVGVVIGAALIALLPLVLNYGSALLGRSTLTASESLAAHLSAAVALAGLAGVLLARSRVRDRTRQRNTDLAVALRTMFAYGEQIGDPDQRQRFISEMGRIVIEAYLRQEASTSAEDTGRVGLAALANR